MTFDGFHPILGSVEIKIKMNGLEDILEEPDTLGYRTG